ncbi:MAG: phosphate uptake regulator PhoU [DPANN group archaeon]|nr:phosphate uptake regulator PhoU [DPANN group archaeon]
MGRIMDTRKLIRFGRSSFVISLPKTWITANGLKKGDVLGLEVGATTLKISPHDEPQRRPLLKKTILQEGNPLSFLQMEIVSAYLSVANIIEVKAEGHLKHAQAIKKILHGLTGLEVIEISKDRILARDILDEEAVSIDRTLRHIHRIVSTQLRDCVHIANKADAEEFFDRDRDINRLVFLLFRVLRYLLKEPSSMQEKGLSIQGLHRDWSMTMRLEHLGDHAKRIARAMVLQKGRPATLQKMRKLHGRLFRCFENTMKAYYAEDYPSCYTIETHLAKLADQIEDLMARVRDKQLLLALVNDRLSIGAIRHMGRAMLNMQELQEIETGDLAKFEL